MVEIMSDEQKSLALVDGAKHPRLPVLNQIALVFVVRSEPAPRLMRQAYSRPPSITCSTGRRGRLCACPSPTSAVSAKPKTNSSSSLTCTVS